MNTTQASETLQHPKFNPYPLFLYAIVNSIGLWLCLNDFLGLIFYPEAYLSVHLFPGFLCAQITILGIIAGLVGRHWLIGMSVSLGLQTLIWMLTYGLEVANLTKSDSYIVTRLAIGQYSVLSVVLVAIPSLAMRQLKSWRIAISPIPYKSKSILELSIATTFVAMVTASEIKSHEPVLNYSIYFAALGTCLVGLFLPVVRMSLEESTQSGSNFNPKRKEEVVSYSLLLGIAGTVVIALIEPRLGLWFGVHYVIFMICLWMGIWCLGASGLRFRNQSMDDQSLGQTSGLKNESEIVASKALDSSKSPFSDVTNETHQSNQIPEALQGIWALMIVALIIAGFTLFKMWIWLDQ